MALALRGCFPPRRARSRRGPGWAHVRSFTAADDLIRVLTYVSACWWLPLNECPYVLSTGQ
jgi:hypothetical protein